MSEAGLFDFRSFLTHPFNTHSPHPKMKQVLDKVRLLLSLLRVLPSAPGPPLRARYHLQATTRLCYAKRFSSTLVSPPPLILTPFPIPSPPTLSIGKHQPSPWLLFKSFSTQTLNHHSSLCHNSWRFLYVMFCVPLNFFFFNNEWLQLSNLFEGGIEIRPRIPFVYI